MKHVAVLMGGWSAEREVSLRSGAGCAAALEGSGYRVTRIDVARDNVTIAPVPGAAPTPGAIVNFGVTAAKALEERKIDGFWANGMATEVAVRRGVGTLILDVRRGDGPPGARF